MGSVYSFSLSDPSAYNTNTATIRLPITGDTTGASIFHSSNGTTWNSIGGTVSGSNITSSVPSFSYFVVTRPITGPTSTPTVTPTGQATATPTETPISETSERWTGVWNSTTSPSATGEWGLNIEWGQSFTQGTVKIEVTGGGDYVQGTGTITKNGNSIIMNFTIDDVEIRTYNGIIDATGTQISGNYNGESPKGKDEGTFSGRKKTNTVPSLIAFFGLNKDPNSSNIMAALKGEFNESFVISWQSLGSDYRYLVQVYTKTQDGNKDKYWTSSDIRNVDFNSGDSLIDLITNKTTASTSVIVPAGIFKKSSSAGNYDTRIKIIAFSAFYNRDTNAPFEIISFGRSEFYYLISVW